MLSRAIAIHVWKSHHEVCHVVLHILDLVDVELGLLEILLELLAGSLHGPHSLYIVLHGLQRKVRLLHVQLLVGQGAQLILVHALGL